MILNYAVGYKYVSFPQPLVTTLLCQVLPFLSFSDILGRNHNFPVDLAIKSQAILKL